MRPCEDELGGADLLDMIDPPFEERQRPLGNASASSRSPRSRWISASELSDIARFDLELRVDENHERFRS